MNRAKLLQLIKDIMKYRSQVKTRYQNF